jgi:hypothetical protein
VDSPPSLLSHREQLEGHQQALLARARSRFGRSSRRLAMRCTDNRCRLDSTQDLPSSRARGRARWRGSRARPSQRPGFDRASGRIVVPGLALVSGVRSPSPHARDNTRSDNSPGNLQLRGPAAAIPGGPIHEGPTIISFAMRRSHAADGDPAGSVPECHFRRDETRDIEASRSRRRRRSK